MGRAGYTGPRDKGPGDRDHGLGKADSTEGSGEVAADEATEQTKAEFRNQSMKSKQEQREGERSR